MALCFWHLVFIRMVPDSLPTSQLSKTSGLSLHSLIRSKTQEKLIKVNITAIIVNDIKWNILFGSNHLHCWLQLVAGRHRSLSEVKSGLNALIRIA